jgi:hypothetical protein
MPYRTRMAQAGGTEFLLIEASALAQKYLFCHRHRRPGLLIGCELNSARDPVTVRLCAKATAHSYRDACVPRPLSTFQGRAPRATSSPSRSMPGRKWIAAMPSASEARTLAAESSMNNSSLGCRPTRSNRIS